MRKLIALIVLLLLMTAMSCGHLLIDDKDKFPTKTTKFCTRLILGLGTLGMFEVYGMGEAQQSQNKKHINELWEQFYLAQDDYQRHRLIRQISELEKQNREIDVGQKAFADGWAQGAENFNRGMQQNRRTYCNCYTYGSYTSCDCR